MTEPRIADIPSLIKLRSDVKGLKMIKKGMPFMRPLLRVLGVETKEIDEALMSVDELDRRVKELAELPDAFNDHFAPRGWIAYDLLNVEVAKAALEKAKTEGSDAAENLLVDYYTTETVRSQLLTMNGVKAFAPRMALAEKALADYEEERYHACVPVVLALIDGFVNELSETRRGFFAEGADLQAWDSIAGHSKGLKTLAALFQTGRKKTRTEPITVPYRNGIMHGMDLGYDNRMVAAKTWAALFAVRDWAIKAEKKDIEAPESQTTPSFRESWARLNEVYEDRERMQRWRPRDIKIDPDGAISGDPTAFVEGTPEHLVSEFLTHWKSRNYGYMSNCAANMGSGIPATNPADVRREYAHARLEEFSIVNIVDKAPAMCDVEVQVRYVENGEVAEKRVTFSLMNTDPEGNPVVVGKLGSKWGIINWMVV